MREPLTIVDVVQRQLCLGCGMCAHLAPDDVTMVDDLDQGRRPLVMQPDSVALRQAMSACPGARLEHEPRTESSGQDPELFDRWGPVLEIWEGYATDPEIRWSASSGGAATAVALFALEQQDAGGVLHIDSRPDVPWLNRTVLSHDRAALLAATGSRYAPASPCDGLSMVEQASEPCVFIGKPCDVAAVSRARRDRPVLDRKIAVTIALFCAGTPSTRGTLEMLAAMGVDPDDPALRSVRYRGRGWPGEAQAEVEQPDGSLRTTELTYAESWGEILQKHRQWRCHLCPDHTGEFADIAVGDPWHEPPASGDPGRSLVVARTEVGRALIQAAMLAGYLTLTRARPGVLDLAQPNLVIVRGSVWGRRTALLLAGLRVPTFRNVPTFPVWWGSLTPRQKAQSFVGTWRRLRRRGLRRRRAVVPMHRGD